MRMRTDKVSNKRRIRAVGGFVLLIVCTLIASDAYAETSGNMGWANVFGFTTEVEITESYNDNLFSDDLNKIDSTVSELLVRTQLAIEDHKNNYALNYELASGFYSQSSDDDYIDSRLNFRGHIEPNNRHRIGVNIDYFALHEERGSTFSSSGVAKPDEFTINSLSFKYGYGLKKLKKSSGNLEFYSDYTKKRYDNNFDTTKSKELDTSTLGTAFFFKSSAKTEFLLDVALNNYSYVLSSSTKDSNERSALLGLSWDTSAKTRGVVKIGGQDKRFDSSKTEDAKSQAWEVTILWDPLSYSLFTFSTERKFSEPSLDEDYVEGVYSSISWSHQWKKRFSTKITISLDNEDLLLDEQVISKRKTGRLGLSGEYEFLKNINVSLGYEYSKRDNDIKDNTVNISGNRNFTRNIYNLALSAAI